MRENKYRVWNKTDNRMETVRALQYAIKTFELNNIMSDRGIDDEKTTAFSDAEFTMKHPDIRQLPFDQCVLMQYAGLKDKNGKDIYERDIINATNMEFLTDMVGILTFGKHMVEDTYGSGYGGGDAYGYYIKSFDNKRDLSLLNDFDENSLEVVGNVHENPELSE